MSHIFISYSRRDIDFAQKIVTALAENDLDTWVDWKSIPKGEDWEQEIYRGIEEADAFLFLISPDSVASKMCNKEIAHAVKNGKRILPIFISKEDPGEVHKRFHTDKAREEISKHNYIFCHEGQDDFNKAIEEIQATIHTDYEWLKYHTELQVKALKWEQKKDNSRLLRGRELGEAEQIFASASALKDPQPTNLQLYFISISRSAEQNRKKTIIGILTAALGIICLFCVVAIVGGGIAYMQSTTAATAQVQVTEQKNIADTRQLATVANKLSLNQGYTATLSGLLSVEAAKRYPELESDQALRRFLNVAGLPISTMKHDDQIFSVAFHPSGDKIATGSIDGTIRVWDVKTGQELSRLMIGTYVYYVAFSPNGKWLIAFYCERMEDSLPNRPPNCINLIAQVWNTSGWKEILRIVQGNGVNSAAFSPDSNLVVTGGNDGTVIVWEITSGKKVSQMKHGETEFGVSMVAFSPNGKLVASASPDHTAIVWDVATGNEVTKLADTDEIDFVSFSRDGKSIVSGGHIAPPVVWDARTGQEISHLDYDGSVDSSVFSPDNSRIVSGGNNIILIWNPTTGQIISRINTVSSGFSGMFSPDGKQIFSVGEIAQVWDVSTGVEIKRMVLGEKAVAFSPDGTKVAFTSSDGEMNIGEFPSSPESISMTHEDSVETIAFNPNGDRIISGSFDGTTRVWDLMTGQELTRVTVDGLVVAVDISTDGKWVAQGACEGVSEGIVACGKAIVRIWDVITGEELYQLKPDFAIRVVKFTPDSKNIILAGDHGKIQLWDIHNGRLVQEYIPDLTGSEAFGRAGVFIETMDIDPSGRLLVAGSAVSVQVWELDSAKEVFKMDGGSNNTVFSPSGKWIASSSTDNELQEGIIRVWNPESGNELVVIHLNPPNYEASSLVFSPDEKWLVAANGNMIRVWELPTGREVSRVTFNSHFNSVDFDPNGKWIASGSIDNSVKVWLWRPEDLIADVCNHLLRNLTHEEWKTYIGDEPYRPSCLNLPTPAE